jgi:hypothetical protein
MPPLENGWQRNSRRTPIIPPFKAPYFCTASRVYCEQVGWKRQEGGNMGETCLLYPFMSQIANRCIIHRPPSSSLFGLHDALQLAQSPDELPLQLPERSPRRRRTSGNHEVPPPRNPGQHGAENFPQATAHRVPGYRFADAPGHRQAEPDVLGVVRERVHREQLPPRSRALTVDLLELRRVRQARDLAPGQRSDSQTLTPTPAPGRDDPPSSYGAHALAETVRLGPLAPVRLVSALHKTPFYLLFDVR